VTEAFAKVNEVLHRGIRAITKIITLPGMVNLDLSDIRAVMKDGGAAVLAIGSGSGPRRAEEAARRAIYSHFLGFPVAGARRVLVNVVGQERLALREVSEAVELVRKSVDPQANIRFGVGEERTLEEEVEVTLIATGFISRTFILTLTAEETRPLVKPVEPVRRLEPVSPMEELDIPTFIRRAIPLRGQYSVGHSADPSLESGERGGKRKGVSRPRPESPEGEAPEL
jgi:cell division protein FtsZ